AVNCSRVRRWIDAWGQPRNSRLLRSSRMATMAGRSARVAGRKVTGIGGSFSLKVSPCGVIGDHSTGLNSLSGWSPQYRVARREVLYRHPTAHEANVKKTVNRSRLPASLEVAAK